MSERESGAPGTGSVTVPDGVRLVRNVRTEGYRELQNVGLRGQLDEGLVCPLINRELSGSEDMAVGMGQILPGQHHLRHHHPDASEFYVFLAGNPLVHLGDESMRLEPGTAVYIPKGMIHGITNDTDEVVELVFGMSKPADWGFVFDE